MKQKQYMVEFSVYFKGDSDFLAKIPSQRASINELFESGKLVSYSLSIERTKLWGVFVAESESELVSIIEELPLTPYMDYNYSELLFHNGIAIFPTMSLN